MYCHWNCLCLEFSCRKNKSSSINRGSHKKQTCFNIKLLLKTTPFWLKRCYVKNQTCLSYMTTLSSHVIKEYDWVRLWIVTSTHVRFLLWCMFFINNQVFSLHWVSWCYHARANFGDATIALIKSAQNFLSTLFATGMIIVLW